VGRDPSVPLSGNTHIAVFLPYLHYMPLTSGGFQPLMLSTMGDQRCRGCLLREERGGIRRHCWSLCLPFPVAQGFDSLQDPWPSSTRAGTLPRSTGGLSPAVSGLVKVGAGLQGGEKRCVGVCEDAELVHAGMWML